MKSKKYTLQCLFIALFCFFVSLEAANAQEKRDKPTVDKATLNKLKVAVEKSPDSLSFHQAYIKAMGIENPGLEKQYAAWMKKYPKSALVPYALGKAYENEESPKAKPYLLKAVEIDPKFAEAWAGLWVDGERWGDFAQSREYLKKAAESDPSNGSYAFYYASSFDGVDKDKYVAMSLDVVKRFPDSDRGAQALYWLGERSKNVEDKLKYWEMARTTYAPAKFNWSAAAMSSYFDLLLSENTAKALEVAQEMVNVKSRTNWANLATQAKYVLDAKSLISQGKGSESITLLNKVKLPYGFSFEKELTLLKAKAENVAGNTNIAYSGLIEAFAKKPNLKLKAAISDYGTKLGKNNTQVDADIWGQLNLVAKVATPFNLKNYFSKEYTSLADYKGKVVLLTYWFPGCGPCRGEFPHLQTVVNKFNQKDLAYVGINIAADQNDYVVPFLKSSGYSFTPLEDVKGREKGNLSNGGAAPVNFLIDQDGRIIFNGFMINGNNEDELELMISLLVNRKQG